MAGDVALPVSYAEVPPERIGPTLARASLSDRFGPFLTAFARETVGSGGRAIVASDGVRPVALLLTDPVDRISSVFARSPETAEATLPFASGTAVFAEIDLGGRQEGYRVYRADLGSAPSHRLQHRLRRLGPAALGGAEGVLREVYGGQPGPWVRALEAEGEVCLAAELHGEVVGVGWVGVAGRHARLHGLAVRPGYRRLGIATDLIAGRLWYARRAGAQEAISEIADANLPSRAAAERLGLATVGQLFLHLPGPSGAPGAQ